MGGSTCISAVQELVKRLTGKDPNVTVSLDEVFDLGAAVQAGILAGDVSNIVLWGVTPLSSGLRKFDPDVKLINDKLFGVFDFLDDERRTFWGLGKRQSILWKFKKK